MWEDGGDSMEQGVNVTRGKGDLLFSPWRPKMIGLRLLRSLDLDESDKVGLWRRGQRLGGREYLTTLKDSCYL